MAFLLILLTRLIFKMYSEDRRNECLNIGYDILTTGEENCQSWHLYVDVIPFYESPVYITKRVSTKLCSCKFNIMSPWAVVQTPALHL
jgi:hypothetical protein